MRLRLRCTNLTVGLGKRDTTDWGVQEEHGNRKDKKHTDQDDGHINYTRQGTGTAMET